jgi:large subunit ribosomal protein L21
MEKETTAKKTAKKAAKKAATKKVAKKATKKAVGAEFAIIETGGKQYMVAVGDLVDVELLKGDLKEGDKVEFDKVLMVDDGKDTTIGMPYIDGAKVKASYVGLEKGKKLHIVRYKAKSNRDRRIGHRQKYSRVKIETI